MASSSRKKSNSGAAIMFLDDLVMEFLIRLPGKQVARCKCVCKSWRSMIASSHFKDVYGSRQRGLILYWSELDEIKNALELNFSYSSLRGLKEPEFSWLNKLGIDSQPLRMTQIVNGLLCIDHGIARGLTIYNVCTGERMEIPHPLPQSDNDGIHLFLGYDPASRMYKLLRLRIQSTVQAHIITLRPSSSSSAWRELNFGAGGSEVLLYLGVFLGTEMRISPDGFLCWVLSPVVVVLFDLNKEKFHKILHPDGFTDDPFIEYGQGFVQAKSKDNHRLAVSFWHISQRSGRIECFVMDDDLGERWTQHFIEFSREVNHENTSFVVADENLCTSTSDMVLMNDQGSDVCYYVCERTSRVVARFHFGKLPDRRLDLMDSLYPYWNICTRSSVARLSCSFDGNNLHLPLDDILSGRI